MIGFLAVFVAASIAFALVVQGSTSPSRCSRRRASSTSSLAASWASSRRPSSWARHRHPRRVLPHPAASPRIPSCRLREIWEGPGVEDRPRCSETTLIPAFFVPHRLPRPGLGRALFPRAVELTRPRGAPDRAILAGPLPDGGSPGPCSGAPGPGGRRPAGASGRSSRSRRTAAPRTGPRTLASADARDRVMSGRRASPTCTLSTGCTTA